MNVAESHGPVRASGYKNNNSGFTLLELIVVIFIISLLAAIVLPSFYQSGDSALKSQARKTASLLRYLNDGSIASKEAYTLEFDFTGGKMKWKGPDGEKSETLERITSVELPSKGEVKEGQILVFFGPLGIGETLTVHFRDGDYHMDVTLNRISGRVKITGGVKG
jgi:general secretion pathway protein H